MDKLKMHTPDKTDENIEKIAALFPNAVTEVIKGYRDDGTAIVEHAIDFDVLRQELSHVVVEGPQERYQFTWPDKRKSILLANQPIAKTMRPCREESVDFDSTENLYIEGDNLDALKLLQETYLGKVKMIYIDPPYNSGNDFVYDDNFSQGSDEYMAGSGQLDEEGGRLVANLESKGRFHTDWLNMIYPRLKIAKDLLKNDGVLVISIGYQEVNNLMQLCKNLFSNRQLLCVTVQTSGGKPSGGFNYLHEYLIWIVPMEFSAYTVGTWGGKERTPYEGLTLSTFDKTQRPNQTYPIFVNEENGTFAGVGASLQEQINNGAYAGEKRDFPYDYSIAPEGTVAVWPVTAKGKQCVWRQIPERIRSDWEKGYIKITLNRNGLKENKYSIQYLPSGVIKKIEDGELEVLGHEEGVPTLMFGENQTVGGHVPTIWNEKAFFTVNGTQLLKSFFPEVAKVFDYPKSIDLISTIIQATTSEEDAILDFFSGSATTAHAVMQLNAEDGGHRKFIMVQLPEETGEDSEAYSAGYKNICEIGKERIRRAGRKIKDEAGLMAQNIDIGFRVLKIDSTNMRDVYYNPAEIKQDQLGMFADNIKPDRSGEDLLFQVMLDLGILLSSKIEEKEIGGKHVFSVANGYLIACFDNNVTSDTVTEIAKMKPYYAVFRDSSMANDSVATNFEQIFASYSPTTVRKVL